MVKGRVPMAILMVVLTLLCCLLGPLPRLVFLLLCGLAATWETWSILLDRRHPAYGTLLLGFVLVCGALSFLRTALIWYGVAFFAAAQLLLALGALTYREGQGKDALSALTVLVYPASFFGALLCISQTDRWLWPFSAGVLTAWICDSAALMVGKKWGKHRPPCPRGCCAMPCSGGTAPCPPGAGCFSP